jgi:hypothetical protein
MRVVEGTNMYIRGFHWIESCISWFQKAKVCTYVGCSGDRYVQDHIG